MKQPVKRLWALACVCALCLAFTLPVFADLIIPPNNAFYYKHKDELTHTWRDYIVNSEKGHACLYNSPESSIVLCSFSNGTPVNLLGLYTDQSGEVFGVISEPASGWFRMSDLSIVYDALSFLEEHESEIQDYVKRPGDAILATEETPVWRWNYPGYRIAHIYFGRFTQEEDLTERIQKVYTDENGVVWGYIPNSWICMSDPYGEHAEEMETGPRPIVWKTPTPTPENELPANERALLLIGGLVGGVVLTTAVMIVVFFARKKRPKT